MIFSGWSAADLAGMEVRVSSMVHLTRLLLKHTAIGDENITYYILGGFKKALRPFSLESVSVHPVHGNPLTGLLRTFWERDRVLRSPLRGSCVQGAQNFPLISAELPKSDSDT